MTPDDFLRSAVPALRGSNTPRALRSQDTRASIVRGVVRRRRRRNVISLTLAVSAVCFTASSVWAATTGHLSLATVWHSLVTSAEPQHRASHAGTTHAQHAKLPAPEPRVEPIALPAPVATTAPSPTLPTVAIEPTVTVEHAASARMLTARPSEPPHAQRAAHVESPAPTPVAAEPTPAPVPEPARNVGEDLFRAAQHADFVLHDARAALAGWDEYLRAEPNGRFTLEATYNRALDLVRLGQRTEAIAALVPFANGVHGEYRRREATALIGALSRRSDSLPSH